jgi:hypothetical protein
VGGVLFVVLATANGAGYHYGESDQAFYIPVVKRSIDPSLFPRDGPLIDAEGRLMVADELMAALSKTTGASIETMFFMGYLASLGVIGAGLMLIGRRIYNHEWAVAALAAAFTLRHQITRTSANSFEPYFHPRMLAFGFGTLAVAALLRHHRWLPVALVAAAALIHVTTGLWFAVLVGTALAVLDVRMRRLAVAALVAGGVLLAVLAIAGPLRGGLRTMDDTWLQAVASKDSLFPGDWPISAWFANLGLLALLWWIHRFRLRRGDATAEDSALVWGCTALVALFLVTLPAVSAEYSLAVQFQISRVFWLVDFVALVYVISVIAGSTAATSRAPYVAIALVALSALRGTYVMVAEHPGTSLFDVRAPDSPWTDAMAWMARQPVDTHVLANPGHAWKYGTSVRVTAARDVLLEEVKDSALAIYSREVAVRVVDRTNAIGDFSTLTADRARDLARRFDLDYLVTEADLDLPIAYRNGQFRIYSLK